jgi:hypothetical protein
MQKKEYEEVSNDKFAIENFENCHNNKRNIMPWR